MSLARRFPEPEAGRQDPGLEGLQVLWEIAGRLSQSPLREEVLAEVPRIAAQLTGSPAATFWRSSEGRPLTYPAREGNLEAGCQSLVSSLFDSSSTTRSAVHLRLSDGRRLERALCFPLSGRSRLHGFLCIYGSREANFGDPQEQLLSLLASYLIQALDNEALAAQTARRSLALKGLHRIGEAVSTHQDPQQLLQTITDTALEVLAADFVVLYEYLKSERDFRMPPILAGSLRSPEVLAQRGVVISHRESAAFRLLREKKPVYAVDAQRDWYRLGFAQAEEERRSQSFLIREGVVSSAGVPLVLDEEVLGVLFVNYRRPEMFGSEQREHIELFASQAAQTISLAHYSQNLARLTEVGTTLSSAVILNIDQIPTLVYQQIARLFAAHHLYILFYDEETGRYTFPFRSGAEEPLVDLPPEYLRRTLAAYVIRTRQPLLVNQRVYDELVARGEAERLGLPAKVWLGAPMVARGRVLGMIAVQDYDDEEAYDAEDLDLLATVAGQAAIAIDNAQLLQSRDLHHFLRAVLERAVKALDSDAGIVFLPERELQARKPQKIRVAVHYRWPELKDRRLSLGQGLAGTVAKTCKSEFNNDYQRWPDRAPLFKQPEHRHKIGSLIGVPILVRREMLGVMVLTSTPERQRIYTRADIEQLEQFVKLVTPAVDNARNLSFQRALIDNSPYPVIGVDTSGVLTIFNAAAERLTGFSSEQMIGRAPHKIYWNGILETVKIHRKLEREGGYVQLESAVRNAGDEKIPVLLSAAFLTDERGSLLGSITVFEDLRLGSLKGKSAQLLKAIDRMDHSQEPRELMEVLVQEALQLFDADAACLFLAMGSVFRARSCQYRSGQHLPARNLRNMVLPQSSPTVRKILQGDTLLLLHGPTGGCEVPLLPTGRGAALLIRIADENETYGLLALESVEEGRFRFEDRFVQIFAARCAGALRRAALARGRQRVEQALIRSGSTIAAAQVSRMVVHEIKNSLSNLFWTVREIKKEAEGRALSSNVDILDGEIGRLRKLTNQLREFASGKLTPRKSRAFLNDIVARTVEILGSSMRRKGVSYELRLEPSLGRQSGTGRSRLVLVDQDQISQVIINLALNALDALEDGGQILFVTRLLNDKAELQVTDNGSGLTRAQKRKLFQLDLSTKPGGSGLGLAISKIIIEDNHGGKIKVMRSRPGKGTTISVLLPLHG